MDHTGHTGGSTSQSSHAGMVPYLHFAGGDNLFFESWRPTSAGALAGACIGLVVLALLERWLAATRSIFDSHWRQRALALTAARDHYLATEKTTFNLEGDSTDNTFVISNSIQEIAREGPSNAANSKLRTVGARLRTITPFIAAHDIPRGILYTLQMLLAYLLMLAVMTYQAAFIISIILGLGIGEIMFGRVVHVGGSH